MIITSYTQSTTEYVSSYETEHHKERSGRSKVIHDLYPNGLHRFKSFRVDKGHPNGDELHIITREGIIEIYNIRTKRHITDLLARPGQLIRYMEVIHERVPTDIMNKARFYVNNGYNNV